VERRDSTDAPLYTTGSKPINRQLSLEIWRFNPRSDMRDQRLA
jgi:hypothetical protein